jgi:hypothetical protein
MVIFMKPYDDKLHRNKDFQGGNESDESGDHYMSEGEEFFHDED